MDGWMDGLVDVTAYLAVQFPPSLPSSTHSISFAYVVFPPSFRPLTAVFPFHVIDVLLSFLSQQQTLEPSNFLQCSQSCRRDTLHIKARQKSLLLHMHSPHYNMRD